jgi:site-specific DNA-methyltransferase (adenine-specific)
VSLYYDDGNGIQIYHCDCREILPTVKADVLVTDPPYGLADRWTGGTWGSAEMYKDARRWDQKFDCLEELVSSFPQAIVWGGNYYSLPPSRCWLAWMKTAQIPTMADFELAWTSFDRPAKQFTEDRNPDGKREHPTQKPLSLMLWCLGFVDPKEVVVDPFMGSGTTLVAAKQLGRKAIGIEISREYCDVAIKRLQQEILDFSPKTKREPEQASILDRIAPPAKSP